MVAYSFQRRFVDPIQKGAKRQTIRAIGKRSHVKRGRMIQLYFGMRTKHCVKIIDDVPCTLIGAITVDVAPDHIREITSPFGSHIGNDLDTFATSDGFEDAADMHRFWLKSHGAGRFEGRLISWDEAHQ